MGVTEHVLLADGEQAVPAYSGTVHSYVAMVLPAPGVADAVSVVAASTQVVAGAERVTVGEA